VWFSKLGGESVHTAPCKPLCLSHGKISVLVVSDMEWSDCFTRSMKPIALRAVRSRAARSDRAAIMSECMLRIMDEGEYAPCFSSIASASAPRRFLETRENSRGNQGPALIDQSPTTKGDRLSRSHNKEPQPMMAIADNGIRLVNVAIAGFYSVHVRRSTCAWSR